MADERRHYDGEMKAPAKPGRAPGPVTEPDGPEGIIRPPGAYMNPATLETDELCEIGRP